MYKFLKSGNNCNNIISKEDFMNRGRREKSIIDDDVGAKIIKYITIGIGVLAVIVIGLLAYSKSLNDRVKSESLSSEQITNLVNNISNNESTESASLEIGRSINEVANELNNMNSVSNVSSNEISSSNTVNNATGNETNTNNNTVTTSTANQENENITDGNTITEETSSNTEEQKQELSFAKPVEGEIMKDFAKDNLIYSNTLEEWSTHTGIDIKADKTTVVNASEAGTVKSIKNDPRYGLTIVLEHTDGYETVYSNLLTSEFVVEGEKVEKGQALGTVGNTAAFEIADEPHLHFEILKDSVAIDPSIYIK